MLNTLWLKNVFFKSTVFVFQNIKIILNKTFLFIWNFIKFTISLCWKNVSIMFYSNKQNYIKWILVNCVLTIFWIWWFSALIKNFKYFAEWYLNLEPWFFIKIQQYYKTHNTFQFSILFIVWFGYKITLPFIQFILVCISSTECICYFQLTVLFRDLKNFTTFCIQMYEVTNTIVLQLIKTLMNLVTTSLICDCLVSLITIHIIILFLFSLKQINYKTAVFCISCILFNLWLLVSWLIFNQVNFSLDYNLNLNNIFFILPIFNIKIDKLSLTFLFTIYIISIFVHIYQYFYLESEPRKDIFLIGLNYFILSMVLIVISSNWILFFLAWEVLGVSSFFLIGFFKYKLSAWKSAKKAFFFNKISDLLLLVSLGFYLKLNESWLMDSSLVNNENYSIVVYCLTLMAFLKSAQFIFYVWLPDSMEAPIPASALIHSATLVSAGIYIIIRFNLFEYPSLIYQTFIHIIIYSTMIIAPLIASTQTDIKKLLAYSTISNCSFIFFLILIKLKSFALTYFVLHGIIKSSCFLIAGILILIQKHYQDLSKWNITNIYDKLLLLFLSLTTLILSGSPLFFLYNLKSNINFLYAENKYLYLLTVTTLLLYTLISYLYGLKIFYLFINKQTQPIFSNLKDSRDSILSKTILILIIYILLILICVFIYLYTECNWNTTFYNLINLVSILIISLVFLNYTTKWPDYVLIINLVNLIVVFITTFI